MPRIPPALPLLLDTHVWIWLMNGDREAFSNRCLKAIESAAYEGRLHVSPMTVWEIGMLVAKKRIRLGMDCLVWVQNALAVPGTHLCPLSPEIAVDSTRLPGNFHGDPADRLLVATARIMRLTLVTQDEKILRYGEKGFVKAVPVNH